LIVATGFRSELGFLRELRIQLDAAIAAWTDYRTAVAALATGNQSDPALGNPHFVSSERMRPI